MIYHHIYIHNLSSCEIKACGYITNLQRDKLSVGLIAQLHRYCTGIAEVMGLCAVQT